MWDFEHEPHLGRLAERYDIRFMVPSRCADELAARTADIGLVPIAALPRDPGMRILPGCTIASKGKVRSLLLVRRAHQSLDDLRSVAADTASRTTLTYARMLFHRWGNPDAIFYPMAANLDAILARADAAIVIGDPALLALEDRDARLARTGEELVYHDLAEEWRLSTGLPFISAIWGIACSGSLDERVTADMIASRDRGLANLDVLAREWAAYTDARERHPDNFLDVDYDDLVGDPLAVVTEVTQRVGERSDDGSMAVYDAELERSRTGVRAPRHRYDLADFGLTEAQVRAVL